MSGPMAAGFDLGVGVIFAAAAIAQGASEIAAEMNEADRQAEERRDRRREERRRMRAARADGAAQQAQAEAWRTRLAGLLTVVDGAPAADAAARAQELAAATTSLQDLLAAHLARAKESATADARRALVARVLERLQLDADVPLPPDFEALAREIVAAPTAERADALASELRLRVQRWNEERAQAAEQRRRQEAAAVVLEHSLRDLGYAVEDIEETLFIEGGVAHFQKPGWGDYYVRLRLDPQRNAMNFNVVRAGTAGEDRQREDMLAEERWCSEFPQLFDTLKARGITVNVTRLLQAGEAPVQVVDAATLPAREEETQRHTTLKARSLP